MGACALFLLTPESAISRTIDIAQVAAKRELTACVGGFERSLPEIDEMADELHRAFEGKAALRVSAAGMGGKVRHCTTVADA
jgi:hypothetical protein